MPFVLATSTRLGCWQHFCSKLLPFSWWRKQPPTSRESVPKPRVPSLPHFIQRPGSVNTFDISQLFIIENLPKAPNSQKFYQISGELQICHKTDRHQYASSISQFISGPWQLKIPSLELHCSRVPSKHPPQRWRPPQGVAGKHVYACPMHEGFRSYLPLRKNASKSGEEWWRDEECRRDTKGSKIQKVFTPVGQILIKSMPISWRVSPKRFAFGTASENLRTLCTVGVLNRTLLNSN